MNGLDVEHEISFNDEKEDGIVSSDSDNFSIYFSENDSQSETRDLKEFKDDSKFAEEIGFLDYRVHLVHSELQNSNDQRILNEKLMEAGKKAKDEEAVIHWSDPSKQQRANLLHLSQNI